MCHEKELEPGMKRTIGPEPSYRARAVLSKSSTRRDMTRCNEINGRRAGVSRVVVEESRPSNSRWKEMRKNSWTGCAKTTSSSASC